MNKEFKLDDNGKILVTSQFYYIGAILLLIGIIACLKGIFSTLRDESILIYIIPIALVFPLVFHLKCIDIYLVDNSKIQLVKFENNISFDSIEKIRDIHMWARGFFGETYTVYQIIYFGKNHRKRISFVFVHDKKNYLMDRVKEISGVNS